MKCQSHIRYQRFFSFVLSFALFIRLSCAYFDQNITSVVVSYAVVRINRLNLLYMNAMHVRRKKETQRCAASELLLLLNARWKSASMMLDDAFAYDSVSQVECSVQTLLQFILIIII